MPASLPAPSKKWLDLSEAAEILGVHFTTLRRWADAERIPYIRTAGGRRRFSLDDLHHFLAQGYHGPALLPGDQLRNYSLEKTRQEVQRIDHPGQSGWLAHMDSEQRSAFRTTGQRMLGLLLQYNSRISGGEEFLEEGKRMAARYGKICRRGQLSVAETISAFLFFRRSIIDSIAEANQVAINQDFESLRLSQRSNDFFDQLLVVTIDSYCHDNPAEPLP